MLFLFKIMVFQLKIERFEFSMWEEFDFVWLSKLIGECGVDILVVDFVCNWFIEMCKKVDENGIFFFII